MCTVRGGSRIFWMGGGRRQVKVIRRHSRPYRRKLADSKIGGRWGAPPAPHSGSATVDLYIGLMCVLV